MCKDGMTDHRRVGKHLSTPTLFAVMTVQDFALPLGSSILTARTFVGVIGIWLAFKFLQAAYNFSPIHPLSRIPGPKLAAATYFPEFYYDVVRFGGYTKKIKELHAQYGRHPIQ